MENAIKALYMGAGMILGVLLLGVFVYMFRTGAGFGETYEFKKATEQIQAFNAQFEVYGQVSDQNGESKGFSFDSKGNTASDVISCANLAFDINRKNDYDLQNCVQVKVKIGTKEYYIYPSEMQEKNNFIIDSNLEAVNQGLIDDGDYYNFNQFLRDYNNVRIVDVIKTGMNTSYSSKSETMYEYYFDVPAGEGEEGIVYSEVTGKVTSITFEAKKTDGFDNTEYWKDNG